MRDPNARVQQISDDVYEAFTKETAEGDPTYFHSHSCDPNTWMDDEVAISKRRTIRPGEELTIDYAMFEADEGHVVMESCVRGSRLCRP